MKHVLALISIEDHQPYPAWQDRDRSLTDKSPLVLLGAVSLHCEAGPDAVHFCPGVEQGGIHPWPPAQNVPGSFSWVLSLPRSYWRGHSDKQSSQHTSDHWHAHNFPPATNRKSPMTATQWWLLPTAWEPAHSSWPQQRRSAPSDPRGWSTGVPWLYRPHASSHQWCTGYPTGTAAWSCESATRAVRRCSGGIPGPAPELLPSRLPGPGVGQGNGVERSTSMRPKRIYCRSSSKYW